MRKLNLWRFGAVVSALAGIFAVSGASAQIATWDFAGTNGASSKASNSSATGITASAAQVGPGLTAVTYRDGGGLTANGQLETTLAGAKSANDYISFTLTPASGKSVTVTSIDLRPVSQNVSRTFSIHSSVDNFAISLASFTAQSNGYAGLTTVTINGVANQTDPVEFRVYFYGGTDQFHKVGVGIGDGNDLMVYGSVDNVIVTYTLTVNNGSGDGSYAAGTVVNIVADPAPSGQQFANWTGSSAMANASNASTTITMPAANTTVTANYENIPSGEVNVSNITDAQYATTSLATGIAYYVDRTFTITSIPSGFEGYTLIKTQNDDKNQTAVPA
ncbi:MAG: hypothetical protein HC842_07495 [Cytophagales bacterium]|nr:hypothetical protein [Cytophagales bacterium]